MPLFTKTFKPKCNENNNLFQLLNGGSVDGKCCFRSGERIFSSILTDKTVGNDLNKDWAQRTPGSQNPSVQWCDSGDGYYGTYDTDNTPFMTFYDKDGGYVQTYKKGDWSSANSTLRSSYVGSTYKNQEVTGYWESSDPTKKGSYLEVRDNNGKSSSYITVILQNLLPHFMP